MTTPMQEAQAAIQRARAALVSGDRHSARQWAEEATKLAPQLEDPWLILAAVAGPKEGLDYIRKALQINPQSPRAKSGMRWAMQNLGESRQAFEETSKHRPLSATQESRRANVPATPRRRVRLLLPALLLVTGCVLLGAAAVAAMSSPYLASLMARPALASEPTQAAQWAEASIPKPTYTASIGGGDTWPVYTPTPHSDNVTVEENSTAVPSIEPPNALPTASPTELPELPTAEPTWSGTLSMDYVADTPTPEFPPTAVPPAPGDISSGEHWIDVNLSQQMVYAYAGDTLVHSFLVSTGTYLTPTITGKYRIWVKLRYSDMSGPDYYLPNVPYVMYFYKDYGLHGTYWHNNFGTPMSHGCVNLSIPDAEWLYNFSYVGTVVNVHY